MPSWVSPLMEIVCIIDKKAGLVQVYEEHARGTCRGAASWNAYHYKRTSDLVLDAYRDGPRDVLLLRFGEGKLELIPSYSSAGIEKVALIKGDKGKELVEVVYAGLGGASQGITQCRAGAKGIKSFEVLSKDNETGLGRTRFHFDPRVKLHVGIDDTDNGREGATWSLANEIGYKMGKKQGVSFINHTLVQMFPHAPHKTTNCVATVLTFAVGPQKKNALVKELLKELGSKTLSKNTGMAVFEGISIPKRLFEFSQDARSRLVTAKEAMALCDLVDIYQVTGEEGIIGAVGALGMSEEHEAAVVPATGPQAHVAGK